MTQALHVALLLALVTAYAGGETADYQANIRQALSWLQATPNSYVQYNYVVTAAIRLGLFWLSWDDIGLCYIREGADAAGNEFIHLVLGSDPATVPLGINRWGAAFEVSRPRERAGAFFGLLKPTKARSVEAGRSELARERQTARCELQALISRVDEMNAVSVGQLVPIPSDLNVHDLALAQAWVIEPLLAGADRPRVLKTSSGCRNFSGFLFAVRELVDETAAARRTPVTRCFFYHSRHYTLTLTRWGTVPEKRVTVQVRGSRHEETRAYADLKLGRFQILNHSTGRRTVFEILVGTSGNLRGVPVQIQYRPNWWFRLTLNLSPEWTAQRRGPD